MVKAGAKGQKFTVVLEKDDVDGGYSVQCVELPGAISQGETRAEALKKMPEAIALYLEAWPEAAPRPDRRREVLEVTG